jgi:hypothetical protein
MNKKILDVFISLVVVVMLAVPIIAVSATKPMQIAGKWEPTSSVPIPPPKSAGANFFTCLSVAGEFFEGPIIGDFSHIIEVTMHFGEPEQLPPATFNWKIERTFEGTVEVNGDTYEGTLLIRQNAKGTMPGGPGTLKGTWVIISGTGELANLHGQGKWTNLAGGQFSYEGQIHFDP